MLQCAFRVLIWLILVFIPAVVTANGVEKEAVPEFREAEIEQFIQYDRDGRPLTEQQANAVILFLQSKENADLKRRPATPNAAFFDTPDSFIDMNRSRGLIAVGDTAATYIVISNDGDTDLEISDIQISHPQIISSATNLTLQSGTSDSILVHWAPQTAIADSADIVFLHNAASSPDTVRLALHSVAENAWIIDFEADPATWRDPDGYFFNYNVADIGFSTINEHWGNQSYWKSGGAGADTSFLWTPNLDLTNGPFTAGFYHKGFSSGDDSIQVLISLDGGQSSSALATLSNDNSNWQYEAFDLSAYAGNINVKIGWHYFYPDGETGGNSWFMDDLALPPRFLGGNGILFASVSDIDFGIIAVADADTAAITLSNSGDLLQIDSITVHHPDFSILNAPDSIAAQSSAEFLVRFQPQTEGSISATISIHHGGINGKQAVLTIPAAGTGFLTPLVEIPWQESFPDSAFDTAFWNIPAFAGKPQIIDSGGVSADPYPFDIPSPPFMLEISGGGDDIVSGLFDLSGAENMMLSFWKSEHDLEIGEYVLIRYFTENGNWVTLDSLAGTDNGFGIYEPFQPAALALPADAYHDQFQLRISTNPDLNSADEYLFDDFQLRSVEPAFDPPENLTAISGNRIVHLTWANPVSQQKTFSKSTLQRTRDMSGAGEVFEKYSAFDIPLQSDLQYFRIYRSEDQHNYTQIDSAAAGENTYADETVANGTAYWYFLTAVYAAGESDSSNIAAAQPNENYPAKLWEETFQDTLSPDGWQVIDQDGSGSAWEYRQFLSFTTGDTLLPHAGQRFWFSNFDNANGFSIDEWLISPKLNAAFFDSLYFHAGAIDGSFKDSLRVFISTTGNEVSDFTHQLDYFEVDGPISTWNRYAYDLAPFAGRDIYIAINYYHRNGGPNGTSSDNIWLDHFIVSGWEQLPPVSKTMYAFMAGQHSIPPVQSAGSGRAEFLLKSDSSRINYEMSLDNLPAGATSVALHHAAAGISGAPVFMLAAFESAGGDTTLSGAWRTEDRSPLSPEMIAAFCNGDLYVEAISDSALAYSIRGQITFDTTATPLGAPSELMIASSDRPLQLDWLAPAENQQERFNIYRAENGGDFLLLDSTGAISYIDTTVIDASTYAYFVTAFYPRGQSSATDTVSTIVTGIEPGDNLPQEFSLSQNYPNPFNPETSIQYGLKESAQVTLAIYNVLGQLVRVLVNENQTAGFKTVIWDGNDNHGKKAGSGIYIYKIEAAAFSKSMKMVLVR